MKKRERVLSACGVRKQSICTFLNNLGDSPRKDVPPTPVLSNKPRNKQPSQNMLPKLPPRPNGQNNASYKLPPRPLNNSRVAGSNRSIDTSREKNRDRSMSKENLRNAGERIVSGGQIPQPPQRIQRSSSAQKVVYPSWWA